MFPDYEQKYLPLVFSVPPRRRPDPGPIDPLADNLGQDQGEVWQGIRRQWEGHGGLQQGGRRPQPLKGRCGEAEDELEHQEAADGRQQERVRQPAAENQRASGESDDKYPQDSDLSTIITWLWSGTNWWHDPISPPHLAPTIWRCQDLSSIMSRDCEITINLTAIDWEWETLILHIPKVRVSRSFFDL